MPKTATHDEEKADIRATIIRMETQPPVLLCLSYSALKRSKTGAAKQSQASTAFPNV